MDSLSNFKIQNLALAIDSTKRAIYGFEKVLKVVKASKAISHTTYENETVGYATHPKYGAWNGLCYLVKSSSENKTNKPLIADKDVKILYNIMLAHKPIGAHTDKHWFTTFYVDPAKAKRERVEWLEMVLLELRYLMLLLYALEAFRVSKWYTDGDGVVINYLQLKHALKTKVKEGAYGFSDFKFMGICNLLEGILDFVEETNTSRTILLPLASVSSDRFYAMRKFKSNAPGSELGWWFSIRGTDARLDRVVFLAKLISELLLKYELKTILIAIEGTPTKSPKNVYAEKFKEWAKINKSWTPLVQSVKGLDLKVGDTVTYINDYGVKFLNLEVIGLCEPREYGECIFLNKSSYWAPVRPSNIVKTTIKRKQK